MDLPENFSLYYYPIIFAMGLVTGFINTVAGGGSLITLPVLIFMGLPGTIANGTNRIAILSQNIFAIGGFRSKGVTIPFPYAWYLGLASLAGGLIGAQLAVDIPDHLFKKILAIVMVGVVILTIRSQTKKRHVYAEDLSRKKQIIGACVFFFLGIYGGFIQAGIGFMVIAAATGLHHFSLVKTNYIKVFAALLYTAVAVLVFAFQDKIMWKIGLLLAVGQGIGAWYASRWSVDASEKWVKRILLVAVIVLAVKLWFF